MGVIQWLAANEDLSNNLCVRMALTLFVFLWQGCAIAALASWAGWLLGNRGANTRYWIQVVALGLMAACPIPTYLFLAARSESNDSAVVWSRTEKPEPGVSRSSNANRMEAGRRAMPQPQLRELNSIEQLPETEKPMTSKASSSLGAGASMRDWALLAARLTMLVYVLGAALMTMRLGWSLGNGRQLCKNLSWIEDQNVLGMVQSQAARVGLFTAPRVAYCQRVAVPMVIGIARPIVLLPAALVSGLQSDQLEALLAHEFAHIRRFDLMVNLFQRLIEAMLFFHPAVWIVSRQISREREDACDDVVLSAGWRRVAYADALIRMAELYAEAVARPQWTDQLHGLAASGVGSTDLKRRVLRILEIPHRPELRLGRISLPFLFAMISLLAFYPLLAKPNNRTASDFMENVPTPSPRRPSNHDGGKPSDTQTAPTKDRFGDALPAGAIARMGTVRFRQGDIVWSVAVSPDGKLVASAGDDDSICVWDAASGKRHYRLQLANSRVRSIDFAPNGKRFAVAAGDSLQVFESATGQLTQRFDVKNVSHVRYSSDGGIVAACGTYSTRQGVMSNSSGVLVVFDVDNERRRLTIQQHQGYMSSLAAASDSEVFVTASHDNSVRLWRIADGAQLHRWEIRADLEQKWLHYREQSQVAISRDGRWVAFSLPNGGIQIADAETGALLRMLKGHEATVTSIAISADGRQLASGARDDRIRVWNLANGQLVKEFRGHQSWVECVAFSPTGEFLVSGSQDGTLRTWPASSNFKPAEFAAHTHRLTCMAISPDGRRLATGGNDGLMIWEAVSGKLLFHVKRPNRFRSISFSPSGQELAVAGSQGEVYVLDARSGRAQRQWKLAGEGASYLKFLKSESDRLLTIGRDKKVQLWNSQTGRSLKPLPIELAIGGDSAVAASIDGKLIAAARQSMVELRDAATGELIRTFRHPTAKVRAIAFSADGKTLATAGRVSLRFGLFGSQSAKTTASTVCLWDTASGAQLHQLERLPQEMGRTEHREREVKDVAFSHDGLMVATAENDGRVVLYDVASGKQRVTLNGHLGPVARVAFSADGRRLASSGRRDLSTLVWDLDQVESRSAKDQPSPDSARPTGARTR